MASRRAADSSDEHYPWLRARESGDVRDLDLQPGEWVDLTSHFEGEERHARQFRVVPYDNPAGCAATYYPEANPLVPLRHIADGATSRRASPS
jgi:hypothetical protein